MTRDVREGAIQIFIRRALRNEPITMRGDGARLRAWYYVADMMEGLMRALENPQAIGGWLDIGNMHAVTPIFGLAEPACRVLDAKSEIVFVDPLSADSGLRIPESKQTEVLLGFKAKVELKDGIRRMARCHEQKMS